MTIGFASQQIYFAPCIFQALGVHPDLKIEPLHSGVSITGMLLVTLFIVFSFNIRRGNGGAAIAKELPGFSYHAEVATGIALLAFVISLVQAGPVLLTGAKKEVMQSIDRFYILWSMASLYGFIVSASLRKKSLFIANLMMLLVTVYVGFRSVAAIAAISYFSLLFSLEKKPISLVFSNVRNVFLVLAVIFFFFVYKGVYGAIKFGYYDVAFQRLLSAEFYASVFLGSEPFGIQRIFSDILVHEFTIGMENLGRVVYNFMLFANDLGADAKSFNAYFQPVLYGDATYGVGSNVWAHVYSSGGWIFLIIFSIIYVLSLRLGSFLLYTARPSLVPIVIVLSAYWAFYIHRNDLLYQIGLERRLVITFLVVASLAWFIQILKRLGWRDARN